MWRDSLGDHFAEFRPIFCDRQATTTSLVLSHWRLTCQLGQFLPHAYVLEVFMHVSSVFLFAFCHIMYFVFQNRKVLGTIRIDDKY